MGLNKHLERGELDLYPQGIKANISQFVLQAIQVFFVGLIIGMERTVLPVVAHRDFHVPPRSFLFLMAFVVSFGFVKGILNFAAGRLSERLGRKTVLLWGWVSALPIPGLIYFAPDWNWIIAANVFLGINQALCWSMTVTSKLDIVQVDQRGFATGVNEFAGYVAVAVAGVVTGYLSRSYGAREALLLFGLAVIGTGFFIAAVFVRETLPWARAESRRHLLGIHPGPLPRFPSGISSSPGNGEIFSLVSFRHPTFSALCQAGTSNKVADALLWVMYPLFLHHRGLSVVQIGWVTGTYGAVWGVSQLWTGPLSDRIGRKIPIVAGLWLLAAGIIVIPLLSGPGWWSGASAVMGVGMALLYPNLIASVADISHPDWRASALGTYRFWRDMGYALGGVVLGVAAQLGQHTGTAFFTTAVILFFSGIRVVFRAEETHPRINPAPT